MHYLGSHSRIYSEATIIGYTFYACYLAGFLASAAQRISLDSILIDHYTMTARCTVGRIVMQGGQAYVTCALLRTAAGESTHIQQSADYQKKTCYVRFFHGRVF